MFVYTTWKDRLMGVSISVNSLVNTFFLNGQGLGKDNDTTICPRCGRNKFRWMTRKSGKEICQMELLKQSGNLRIIMFQENVPQMRTVTISIVTSNRQLAL
jgi:hypothetical protein